MLTLKRFAALAESYGGDLRRWPDDVRGGAQALLNASPQAHGILADAQKLDSAIEAAGLREDRRLLPPHEQEAALARLRGGVTARIAAAEAGTSANRQSGLMLMMGAVAGLPSVSPI